MSWLVEDTAHGMHVIPDHDREVAHRMMPDCPCRPRVDVAPVDCSCGGGVLTVRNVYVHHDECDRVSPSAP